MTVLRRARPPNPANHSAVWNEGVLSLAQEGTTRLSAARRENVHTRSIQGETPWITQWKKRIRQREAATRKPAISALPFISAPQPRGHRACQKRAELSLYLEKAAELEKEFSACGEASSSSALASPGSSAPGGPTAKHLPVQCQGVCIRPAAAVKATPLPVWGTLFKDRRGCRVCRQGPRYRQLGEIPGARHGHLRRVAL